MELVKSKPSPAGELVNAKAVAIRPMEAMALLFSELIDEVHAIVALPMSTEGRAIAIAAFKMLSQFDNYRAHLEGALHETKLIRRKIEGLSNGR